MNVEMMSKALELLQPSDNDVIEVRTVKKSPLSGYFTDKQKCLDWLSKYPNETWYVVMNHIKEACYARTQHDCIMQGVSTTNDNEIDCINWLLIDADPERPRDTSSTDEEKQASLDVVKACHDYLKNEGFPEPVVCDSGNGYHLLYKCHLRRDFSERIKEFLRVMDMYFSTDAVKIDTAVFNPARVTKLYGTIATKGASTPNRPHRQSKIIRVPDPLNLVSSNQIEKICAQIPAPEVRSAAQRFDGTKFDVKAFMDRHGMLVHSEQSISDGVKYILEECPFDCGHKAPDAAVFSFHNGSIGFKCFHNSCSTKTWRDVRLLFDADYANRETRVFNPRHTYQGRVDGIAPRNEPVQRISGTAFVDISTIEMTGRNQIVTMKSNFDALDRKILGFNKGELSIWSGGNGSGKSTFLSQLALECIQNGYKVALYSGELTGNRAKTWLYLQAAGMNYIKQSLDGITHYVSKEAVPLIDGWLKERFFLYTNSNGNKAQLVIDEFRALMDKHSVDVFIMDNLMSLDISSGQFEKYDNQTNLVLQLSALAKERNCHIHFVCHPRKPNGFLRKADIAGTSDITNAADNVLMMHRVNDDFKRNAKEFYGAERVNDFESKGYSNMIEIMKNRDLGVQDEMAGLYFEPACKQFLNEAHQNRVYSWIEDTESDCPF